MTSDSGESPLVRISPLRRWGAVAGAVAVVLLLDQLSKSWALRRLLDGEIIDLLPTLSLRLTFNTGMAFSKGSAAGPLIGLVAIVIATVLVLVARRLTSVLQLVLVGVVIGGALGNVIDRLTRVGEIGATGTGFMSGAVVDFIDVSWWAVFNVAETAIVVGGLALALTGFRTEAAAEPAAEPEPESDAIATSRTDDSSDRNE